jgi:hypothetical protein
MCDDPSLDGYNIPERVSAFISAAYLQASEGPSSNILVMMGEDFTYENAESWFINMDLLIKHGNILAADGDIPADPYGVYDSVKLVYSNPELLTKAKNDEKMKMEVKSDDFMPYSDCSNCFWTGYFTSRAELKKFERVASSFLQAARQIEAFSSVSLSSKEDLFTNDDDDTSADDDDDDDSTVFFDDSKVHKLEAAVAVVQHHDGTC